MAILPVGASQWGSAHDSIATGSAVVAEGDNRILVVSYADFEVGGDASVSGISSDLDGAFTRLGSNINSDQANAGIFYLLNPTVGTHVLTPAYGDAFANKPNPNIAHWYTGVDQDTPFGAPASDTGTTETTATVTVTDVAEGDLVIDAMGLWPTRAITEGANQTEPVSGGNTFTAGTNSIRLGVSYQAGVDGGVMSYTFTAAEHWAHLAAALKPAAEAPAAAYPHLGPPPHLSNRHFSNLHLG
jgi:hypothetical protein